MRQIYVLRDYEEPDIIFETLIMKEGSTFDMDIIEKEVERRWSIAMGNSEYGEYEIDEKLFTKEEIAEDPEEFPTLLDIIIEKYGEHYEHAYLDYINLH